MSFFGIAARTATRYGDDAFRFGRGLFTRNTDDAARLVKPKPAPRAAIPIRTGVAIGTAVGIGASVPIAGGILAKGHADATRLRSTPLAIDTNGDGTPDAYRLPDNPDKKPTGENVSEALGGLVPIAVIIGLALVAMKAVEKDR